MPLSYSGELTTLGKEQESTVLSESWDRNRAAPGRCVAAQGSIPIARSAPSPSLNVSPGKIATPWPAPPQDGPTAVRY